MSAFTVERGLVVMDTSSGPVRLQPEQCEGLLDIFDRAEAVTPFNDLWDAHVANGGLPRVSSLKGTRPTAARPANRMGGA